jgi:hypothetical protein
VRVRRRDTNSDAARGRTRSNTKEGGANDRRDLREIEAQRQAELPFARARLEHLIETRAKERAEAMTAEQIAELVEQRSQEKAQALHEEQKRLELEAVKADLAE